MNPMPNRPTGAVFRSLKDLPASDSRRSVEKGETTPAITNSLAGDIISNESPTPARSGHVGAAAGDQATVTLTFSTEVGAPETNRARIVVKTMTGSTRQKLDAIVASEQAVSVLMELLRNAAPDLFHIANRFVADPPQK